MALVIADRVQETTTTTGTGTITLAGAVSGFQSFSVIGNGNTTYYTIAHTTAAEWEVGIGTYTSSGTTLARTTILSSSNSNNAVNFSAGTKNVFCTYPAGRAVEKDASNILTLDAGTTTIPPLAFQSGTNLTTATAGSMEYNGKSLLFTPTGTQRGIVPGMQYYRLENAFTGANQTAAQSWFNGTGNLALTLSASTIYSFEALFYHFKATTSTSHTLSSLFGGTATLNNIIYQVLQTASGSAPPQNDSGVSGSLINTASAWAITGATTVATYRMIKISGTVSVNAGGTFIPQYSFSAAPNAGYTTGAGSYFLIYPIGASGANVSVGTWA
jgi:hypothetical protein